MDINRRQQGRVSVLTVRGAMIEDKLHALNTQVEVSFKSGSEKIVLEFVNVPFIDSASLERIADLADDCARRGGDLRLAFIDMSCREIFELTRMADRIGSHGDAETAARSLV